MRLIDADALISDCLLAQKQAERHGREYANAFYSGGGDISTEWWCVEDMIENAPTIEERKKGQWRNIQIGEWLGVECTACKIAHDWREVPHVNGGGVAWYFCPECGADMRGEGNG